MDYKKLKKMNTKFLQSEFLKYKREYMNLRFQKALGELHNTARIKAVKKNIARIFTIFRCANIKINNK